MTLMEHETITLKGLSPRYEHQVFTDNGTSYYVRVANAAADKCVVLQHGVTGNSLDMVIMAQEFIANGYAIYLPDLPGHGKAPTIPVHSFDDMGDWMAGCLRAIGRTPAAVICNSFGSAICYNYAARYPVDPATLIVLGCPTPLVSVATELLRRSGTLLPAKMSAKLYNLNLSIQLRTAYLQIKKDKIVYDWLIESEKTKAPFIDVKMVNIMSRLLLSDNPYKKYKLPADVQRHTLVVYGDRDNVVPKGSSELLHNLMPDAQFEIIPGVGHILHFEAHHEYVQSVLDRIKN